MDGTYSIAIVGGNGFVGSSVAERLSANYKVTILDVRPPAGTARDFKFCDIRDRDSLMEALQGFDLVVNTAIVQVPEINQKKRLGYEVNVLGVQSICEAVEAIPSIKGLIHAGSWHVFGERDIRGTLDEEFGFRPDKIEQRAKLYALCKIAQETVIRIVSDMSAKCYGIVRLGTVLGDAMPKQTAANIFIENALRGEPITPFVHTQHRPMLYVDIKDVGRAFESFASLILQNQASGQRSAIVNLVASSPVTLLELAQIVRSSVIMTSHGKIKPMIEVVDKHIESLFSPKDKRRFKVDNSKTRTLLRLGKLITPKESVDRIIRRRASLRNLSK